MRDPKRIPIILEHLRRIWEKNPDLRLGQIIVNITSLYTPCPEIYHIEDWELLRNLVSKMGAPNLEKAVHDRKQAYDQKDYETSDMLRAILEKHNIFCFDHPDGFHEVHYYPPEPKLTREEVEERIRKDRKANAVFDAWLVSVKKSNNKC